MGVPKFYRWLSERYPLINQPGATVFPVMDNLYLDMNGIIHNCTHGNREDVSLSEEEMVESIFRYLDKIMHIMRPQKLLFMAVDGVAPRAKMNQQRSRRFKTAKEAEAARLEAEKAGEAPEKQRERFDSNCITPGTAFMARLSAHVKFFIRKRMAEDPVWRRPTVVFSGHDVPGEGEHKIMEYIRWMKRDPGYLPNTRHCLYGLDADLIMLALVSHEPHFCLLREVVSYTGGGRGQPSRDIFENPCQEHFVILHIGLLRDYLELEFSSGTALPFAFDLERVIDDLILFCMLVGNDFLPPLPTLDIAEGSLDKLFELYKALLPEMGGYVSHGGHLHRGRLELLLRRLAATEAADLASRARDAAEAEERDARRAGRGGRGGGAATPAWASEAPEAPLSELLQAPGHELELLAAVEGDEAPPAAADPVPAQAKGPTMMSAEARALFAGGDDEAGRAAWRERYYRKALGPSDGPRARRGLVEAYVAGLHWVLEYYYRGLASWEWFFPHHYAPMASDLVDLPAVDVSFRPGHPFRPFEQLLAVQPAACAGLLPEPFRPLMTTPQSPIADFYPSDFAVDLEGKRADWEAVVLIPFVDADRLLRAARSVPEGALSPEERARNRPGPMVVFTSTRSDPSHSDEATAYCASTLPARYADVSRPRSRAIPVPPPPALPAGERGFAPELVPGTNVGVHRPPGFPALRALAAGCELRRAGVSVFGRPSRRESVLLAIKPQLGGGEGPTPSAAELAPKLLGQRLWAPWPFMRRARVVALEDAVGICGDQDAVRASERAAAREALAAAGGGGGRREGRGQDALAAAREEPGWTARWSRAAEECLGKQGLVLSAGDALLAHVACVSEVLRRPDGSLEEAWEQRLRAVPVQLLLGKHPSPDPRVDVDLAVQVLRRSSRGELDPILGAMGLEPLEEGSRALLLSAPHYGCVCSVLATQMHAPRRAGEDPEPLYHVRVDLPSAAAAMASRTAARIVAAAGAGEGACMPLGQLARRAGLSPRAAGSLLGSVWVETEGGRVDVGLCVRNASKALAAPDAAIFVPGGERGDPTTQGGDRGSGTWLFTPALALLVEQYRQRFPFVWQALESEDRSHTLSSLLPGSSPEDAARRLASLRAWLKSQPLSRRPLVTAAASFAPDEAVRALQAALPPPAPAPACAELRGVSAARLLPPALRGGVRTGLSQGPAALGDRVVALGAGAPLGASGTVTGLLPDALEVVFDAPFPGGEDLFGRCRCRTGAFVKVDQVLNLGAQARAQAPKSQPAPQPRWQESGGMQGLRAGLAQGPPPGAQRTGALPRRPVAPSDASGRGFGMGRGRGMAGGASAQAPGQGDKSVAEAQGAVQSGEGRRSPSSRRTHPRPAPTPPPPAGGTAPDLGTNLLSMLQGRGAAPAAPALSALDLERKLRGSLVVGGSDAAPPPVSASSQPKGEVDPAQFWLSLQSGKGALENAVGPGPRR